MQWFGSALQYFLKNFILKVTYVYLFVFMSVCMIRCVRVPTDVKEGIGYSEAGVTYYYKLPNVGTENPISAL